MSGLRAKTGSKLVPIACGSQTLRYQSGEATALEVVDAQNTLATARNNFDDGQVRYRVALANLQTLTGPF